MAQIERRGKDEKTNVEANAGYLQSEFVSEIEG
jgi:hypothetical protein